MMRIAITADLEYRTQCLINISLELKAKASDIYMDGLPRVIDETTLKIATSYINRDNAIAFIYEINGSAVGCLAVKIPETSFTPSSVGSAILQFVGFRL